MSPMAPRLVRRPCADSTESVPLRAMTPRLPRSAGRFFVASTHASKEYRIASQNVANVSVDQPSRECWDNIQSAGRLQRTELFCKNSNRCSNPCQ